MWYCMNILVWQKSLFKIAFGYNCFQLSADVLFVEAHYMTQNADFYKENISSQVEKLDVFVKYTFMRIMFEL